MNSQGHLVPNRQGSSMPPAPTFPGPKGSPASQGGHGPWGAASVQPELLDLVLSQHRVGPPGPLRSGPAPSPPATEHGSAPRRMLSAPGLKSQTAQVPALPSHKDTLTRMHSQFPRSERSAGGSTARRRWCRCSVVGSPRRQLPNHRQRLLQPRQSSRHEDVSELKPGGMEKPQLCTGDELNCSPHRGPFHISHSPSS